MLANVFVKTLRDLRRSTVGWGLGLAVLVAVMASIWPSIRAMPDLEQFLANYPEAMRELFNIEAITTGAGYLNAELFSILLPALFIVHGIGRGARLVAGEEEAGILECLVVTPVTRLQLLVEKAAALGVAIATLGIVLFLATWASATVVDMGIAVGDIAVGSLAMVLLGVEHGWLALAVGAATGRRALSVGVASTVAVAGYVLYVLGLFVESMQAWQPLSPFHQALDAGPLGGGGVPAVFAWMALGAVVVVGVAVPLFDRRDVAAR